MRRFINVDIIAGEISEAITLNRYAYANGNPVSNIDPFGLSSRDSDFSAYDIMSEAENIVSATDYSIGFISDSKDFAYKYLVDSIAGVGIGMAIGSVLPGAGTVVGAVIGLGFGILFEFVYTLATEELEIYEWKSIKEISKETQRNSMDAIWDLFTP